MKTRFLLFMAITGILSLASCEAIKDALEQEVDVTLNVDIPLSTSSSTSSLGLKSTKDVYSIAGTATLNLEDEEDVKDFVDGINNFVLNNPGLALKGLGTNDTIYTLTLSLTTSGNTYTPFDETNLTTKTFNIGGVFTYLPVYTSTFETAWKEYGFPVVSISISGTSNFEMNEDDVVGKLKLPGTVTYSPL